MQKMATKQNNKIHWLNIARRIIPDFNINLLTNVENCWKKSTENTIPLLNTATNSF